jgi:hypothetical protein
MALHCNVPRVFLKEDAMKKVFSLIAVAPLLLLSATAFAERFGAVNVECWGRCDLVNLGQICDTYIAGSEPSAVACDDTGTGAGADVTCGSGTCSPYSALERSDSLSAYCDDGPGFDAVVSCRAP